MQEAILSMFLPEPAPNYRLSCPVLYRDCYSSLPALYSPYSILLALMTDTPL